MPCRSASVSLAKATSNLSRMPDQPRHRVGRRAVHPDLAVPIHRHEAECRVDGVADDIGGETIALDDRLPVMHAAPPSGSIPILTPEAADRFHVDDVGEVGDIRPDIVMAVNAGRFARALVGNPFDAREARLPAARSPRARSRR